MIVKYKIGIQRKSQLIEIFHKQKEEKMKNSSFTFLIVFSALGLALWNGCSRIEIQSPAQDEQNISTPYTMVVKHSGCGNVKTASFEAWLDKDSDAAQEITSAFTYAQGTWTAKDYNLPMGNHSLSVRADVETGSWCYERKRSDLRKFFVAPCTDFVTAWGEDFEMTPDTLTIQYGENSVKIAQGQTQVINLPDNSPLLIDGKLPAIVKYGIRNKTTKNLKFRVLLRHGDTYLDNQDLAFCGQGVVDVQHSVSFSPSSDPLTIIVEAGDILNSPSDDTRPVFFNGKLQVRVYPL
jgi:hypothetical protein